MKKNNEHRESIDFNNDYPKKSLDTTLDDTFRKNDESFKSKKDKKKKKHNDLSLIDFAIDNTEKNIFDDSCAKEFNTSEKNNQNLESLDTTLDDTYSKNDESLKSKKHKKKRKHNNDLDLKDFAIDNTEKNIFDDSCAKEFNTSEKNNQNPESLDTTLDDTYSKNDESLKSKKHKKKRKHNNDLDLIDFAIDNTEKNIFDDSCAKEFNTSEKNNQNLESLDTTLDDTYSKNDESLKSKKHKKKRKHNNDLDLIDFATNDTDKKIIDENDVSFDDICPKECVTTEKKHQNYESDDTFRKNDESFKSKKDKKKKKHNNDLSLIDFAIDNTEKNIFDDSCAIEFNTSEKNNQNLKSLDTTLDDTYSKNDESLKSKKHKKKRKHNNDLDLIDFATNDTDKKIVDENDVSFDDICPKECVTTEKKHQNFESVDTFSINDESFKSKEYKKKKKHNNDLSSLDTTKRKRKLLNDINFKLSGKKKKYKNNSTYKIIDEFTNIVKDIKSLQQNIIISDDNSTVEDASKSSDNHSNNTVSIDSENNSQIISNSDTTVNHNVSQENIEFEDILSFMYLHNIENAPTTTETQVQLDKSKLINDIINNETLNSHPDFDLIVKYFTSEMKKILIKRCVSVLPSEIIILKLIGKKVLEKCVEKQKNLKIVENLQIVVPSKSKENKIHYVETTLTKYPKNEIIEKIKKLNSSTKFGVFNEEEDNLIKKYWLKFQQEYKISDVRPFLPNGLDIALHSSKRLSFIRYISVELPNRLLYSVYNRFVVLFDKRILDKLSFRKEEDTLIMQVHDCVAIRNKYTVLNVLLNRTKQQLIRRINYLKLHSSCKERIIWNIEKRQELFSRILFETNTTNWTDLENLKIGKKTWIKVAKNFSVPISVEKLSVQWKFLSTMLFCKQPICYSTFKLNILKLLLEKNVKYWSDINWNEITNQLYPGANCKVIFTIFSWWMYKKVPAELRSNIRGTLNYLATILDSDIEKLNEDRTNFFPRFIVTENNELKLKEDY